MKHIVNFSGGYCSFWAAHRVIAKHGADNVVLLFADVLIEDASLYAFNAKASELLGVPITRISKGLTPWQLFRSEGMIGSNRFPICSTKLKREMLDGWTKNHCLEYATTIYLGFDWTESHRLKIIREANPTWNWQAPMTEEPIWDKCKMQMEGYKLGLPKQVLYEAGFPHNNCGGRCVRAGISHWVHLLKVFPDRFKEWEDEELSTQADFLARGISSDWLSILKDRRNGESKPMNLRTLRLRVEAGETFDRYDWGGCGCAGQ